MQPQGHTQVMVNTLDYGMNPQAALDAPRWMVHGNELYVEPSTPAHVVAELIARGHAAEVIENVSRFGRGQIIWRLPSGAYAAGSEPRCDGCAVGW